MDQLINDIERFTKKSFQSRKDESGKPLRNIANYGLKAGKTAINFKGGEYDGLKIEALIDIPPLLTDFRVIKAIKALKKNDFESCTSLLYLQDYVIKYGIVVIYYILSKWLTKNDIQVPIEISSKIIEFEDPHIDNIIYRVRYFPIDYPIKIVEIGLSKDKIPVVPKSWSGAEFPNAHVLHSNMDELPSRKGKPPVCYCATYALRISDDSILQIYTGDFIPKEKLVILTVSGSDTNTKNLTKTGLYYKMNLDRLFLIIDSKIIRDKEEYRKCDNVGMLASRMQKSIRYGPKCAKLLVDTIEDMAYSKPYSLPEQQYIRVSGSKQLVWRLFISIIEDSEPLNIESDKCYRLYDLLCMAILFGANPKLQISDVCLKKIIHTALVYQSTKECWKWRDLPKNSSEKNNNKELIKTMELALTEIPMMGGDRVMLTKSIKYLEEYAVKNIKISSVEEYLSNSDNNVEIIARIKSIDNHCKPNIILDIQSCLPIITNYTTKDISSALWTYSSSYNYREPKNLKIDGNLKILVDTIYQVQTAIFNKTYGEPKLLRPIFTENEPSIISENCNKLYTARKLFLLLFGKSIQLGKYLVIPSDDDPIKIKWGAKTLDKGSEYDIVLQKYYEHYKNIKVSLPKNYQLKTPTILDIKDGNYYVNNIKINRFDASNIIPIKHQKNESSLRIVDIDNYIKDAFYYSNSTFLLHTLNLSNINLTDYCVDWTMYSKNIPLPVWNIVYTKVALCSSDYPILIGPVDRRGKKIQEAINYLYEGIVLRVFKGLCCLYPSIIKNSGKYKFLIVNKDLSQYFHLINCLKKIIQGNILVKELDSNVIPFTITTKLWDHQRELSEKIISDIKILGKRGFGDASYVGAGKTLSALKVLSDISTNFNGPHIFLVLLPVEKLYNTWIGEIEKHCINYNYVTQNSGGELSGKLMSNTILITTLGRFRDTPIYNIWSFVVIDECLSVQNSGALQTIEALKAVTVSKFGCLMLSATFFRSRFDKLFYLLRMLDTGLPLEKSYLDTILNETIKAYLPNKSRTWVTNINKFELPPTLREKYNNIKKLKIGNDKIYTSLDNLLHTEFDYISCFRKILERTNRKCLVYANSKEELDAICTIDNIGRYPDKTKQHIAITAHDGTYGLNDLVKYNCIVLKPPYNDLLPQMKGRLDRPGQAEDNLMIEFIIVKDTIEEALLIKMEVSNHFYKDYIMPLSKYYDIAVKY